MKSETYPLLSIWRATCISIHSLNEEWDRVWNRGNSVGRYFNPLTQWRVRLRPWYGPSFCIVFQSTHSMKSETSTTCAVCLLFARISIHSLNEEWDGKSRSRCSIYRHISIHSLNEEWDWKLWRRKRIIKIFQSTHSMKSETKSWLKWEVEKNDFNPLTQWRVRRSIRSMTSSTSVFQSTHSMKSETFKRRGGY